MEGENADLYNFMAIRLVLLIHHVAFKSWISWVGMAWMLQEIKRFRFGPIFSSHLLKRVEKGLFWKKSGFTIWFDVKL